MPALRHVVYSVKIFLAGDNGRDKIIRGIFIDKTIGQGTIISKHKPFILDTFAHIKSDDAKLIPYYGDYLLDSGAFTFMGGFDYTNKQGETDFDEYIERYADFIAKNKIEKFFELDVDVCVGYEKVKRYRSALERQTNKQPIPVWHSARGKDDFIRCCDEYPYVALGGIVGGEWNTRAEKYIPWFIHEAHKRGAKIHGLGFTKLKQLQSFHFDSVDSTTWINNKYGELHLFDGNTIRKIAKPKGYRIQSAKDAALNNYTEWIKFQKWALTHL